MRLFLVLCAPARAPGRRAAPRAAGGHHRRRLGRHALDGDAQRHGRPERLGHELPLRVRDDDGVRPHLRRRRRRRGRRRRCRVGAGSRASARARPTTTGSSPPTPTAAPRAPTARSAPPPARGCRASPPRPRARSGRRARRCAAGSTPTAAATTYHFEYGLSQTLRLAHAGARRRRGRHRASRVAETIGGLQPYRRYHFRVVATNEAGPQRQRQPHLHARAASRRPITLSLAAPRDDCGDGIEVFGRVSRPRRQRHPGRARAPGLPVRRPVLLDRRAGADARRPRRPLPLLRARAVLRHPPARAHAHRRAWRRSPPVTAQRRACGSGSRAAAGDAPRGADPRLGRCRPCRAAAPCCSG